MSLNSERETNAPTRRRGAALEDALLAAAWDELVERGYDAFTIEAVAERAQTSRAVVYRRWSAKPELVRDAVIRHAGPPPATEPEDTGSLRSDLLALLTSANRRRAGIGIVLLVRLGEYFTETGTSMAELRSVMLPERRETMDIILRRAIERGEADPARISPRVMNVPFDLFRHELLMTLRPVTDEAMESIVDEVFLPLVAPQPAVSSLPTIVRTEAK